MFTKPSVYEKVSGHPVTRVGVAAAVPALAVFNPLAALLPVLTDSLAGELQQRRVNSSLEKIAQTFQEHKEQLDRLSEAQYHLVTEVVSTTFTTINERKLEYLQSAVKNTLHMSDIASQEAVLLGRIVRDISAHEADFLCKNFGNDYIHIGTEESKVPKTLHVREHSVESLVVKGLLSLGVLDMPGGDGHLFSDGFGEGTYFKFSLLAPKIISLLRTA